MGRMGEVTVSVLMLTYNRESMVGRAIDSILSQTFSDFEFIIVDNGSTDQSGAIAEEYAARDSRVRVIHRPRGNIGAGRNTALDAARGKFITFIDDDDWAEPDFLEFLINLIKENGADVAICGATDRVCDEKKVMTAEESLIELMWRKKYNVAFPTKLFRRELMEHLRFPEGGKYDDIALMYRLLAEARTVAYHGLPKYTFYRHPGNNSAWTTDHSLLTPETLQEYLDAYRARTQWLSEKFPNSAQAFQYFEWSFMISMVEKIHRLKITSCKEQLQYIEAILFRNKKPFINSHLIQPYESQWMKEYILPIKSVNLCKTLCVGCGSCKNICPQDSIDMEPDNEGFLYPKINQFKCIQCGECVAHCPIYQAEHRKPTKGSLRCFAGWAKDHDKRQRGSSGSIFGVLAEHILSKGGYVCGAVFTPAFTVEHQIIHSLDELEPLQKSKYVQSNTSDVFFKIKYLLSLDELVLFVGTPCQCMGLQLFLNKSYKNLILCDFVCHGVSSPLAHQHYIKSIQNEFGGVVTKINHRDSQNGWNNFQLSAVIDGNKYLLGGKSVNPFLRGFLTNLFLRPTCYHCMFKQVDRNTDLTLGDCWGYPGNEPDGVSIILTHSYHGQRLIEQLKEQLYIEPYSLEHVLKDNPMLVSSAKDKFSMKGHFVQTYTECGKTFNQQIFETLGGPHYGK